MLGLMLRNPYSRIEWLFAAGVVLIFILVAVISTLENALGVSVSFGVFTAVVQTKWNSRRDPRMWVLVGIVAAIQITAILFIHIPRLSTGLVCLPFALVEAYALFGLLNWMERRFPRA